MTYFLRFAYQLKKEGSQVIGEPELDKFQVRVETSDVDEVIQVLLKGFEKVALISSPKSEESSKNSSVSKVKSKDDLEESKTLESGLQKVSPEEPKPKAVEDSAFVAKASTFNPEITSEASKMLAELLSKISSNFENSDIFSSDLDREFLVMTEAVNLRNFLSRFVKNLSKKKPYKQGYLYILGD